MKKKLLIAVLAFGFSFTQAQDVKIGTKVGLNISKLTGDIDQAKSKIGFHVGGYAEIKFSDLFALQPEILYSTQGTKAEQKYQDLSGGFNLDLTQNLSYINVPVMLKLYVAEKFYIEAGPQIGFLISAEQKAEATGTYFGQPFNQSQTVDNKDDLNSTDFAVNFGLGINLTKNFGAGLRYSLGLSDIDKADSRSEIQNGNIGISVFYNN